ncbi:MAG: flavin reductase family protein [Candidatus Thorarchaeota archaeon]
MLDKTAVSFQHFCYLLHPGITVLVSSQGKDERKNIMAVSWIMPASSNPPLVAMMLAKASYSHELITESEEFVINIPSFDLAPQVLFCGRRSGRHVDKFKEAGLTLIPAQKVQAPIIKECIAHIECQIQKTLETGHNDLVVGRVIAAYATVGSFTEVYNMKEFRPLLHLGRNFFTTTTQEVIEPPNPTATELSDREHV